MAVLSVLMFAVACGISIIAVTATVAPRWALIVALLRHGAAADWAPPAPPRRTARRVTAAAVTVPARRALAA